MVNVFYVQLHMKQIVLFWKFDHFNLFIIIMIFFL